MSAAAAGPLTIGVALKPVPRHLDVDPLTGAVAAGHAPTHASAADLAALELALRLREAWTAGSAAAGGSESGVGSSAGAGAGSGTGGRIAVVVASAAPAERAEMAEAVLRDALGMGADRAIRAEVTAGTPGSAGSLRRTADALAAALDGCDIVLCGDYSDDGGTGAVPALLAAAPTAVRGVAADGTAEIGVAGGRAQALGLVAVEADAEAGVVLAERRLDRGRRERLRVRTPMVLSVEGTAARPRRAALPALLRAREANIEIVRTSPAEPETPPRTAPFRPRARALPPPTGTTPRDRVLHLLGAGEEREPPRRIDAEPPEAAREIVDQLRRWGYL